MGSLVPLSQIAGNNGLIIDGDWVESKDQDPDGEVRLVQLADIGVGSFLDKSNRFMTSEKAVKLKCTFLKPGDILVARMPDPLGRACQFPGDERECVTVVDVCIFRPDESIADATYVTHILNSDGVRKQLGKFIKGTTRQRISRTNLEQIRIPLPPLPEQRRIATILDQANSLRDKRREALAQLNSLTQSIFIEMFGDPATNPKQLPTMPLGQVIKLKSGDFLPASEMATGGSFPVFGGNGINGYHDSYLFDEPKIVIGRVGVYCGCVHVSPANSWITDNALYVSEHDPRLNFAYLSFALKQAKLNQYASQSAQPLISGGRISPVKIIIPAMKDQDRFVSTSRHVENQMACYTDSMTELDLLVASLQHRAFRGEL